MVAETAVVSTPFFFSSPVPGLCLFIPIRVRLVLAGTDSRTKTLDKTRFLVLLSYASLIETG